MAAKRNTRDKFFCKDIIGIGTTVNGGFAEYCSVPVSQVHAIADGTAFAAGAMAEPVSCCLHGIDLCNIRCGDTVAVIGGGMIGMIMVQLAKLSGAAKVVLLEPIAEKRALGKAATMTQAIELAGEKATVMLFGLTASETEISIKPFTVFQKELNITASFINPYTQSRAVRLIDSGKLDVTSPVYATVPLADLPALLADGKRLAMGKYIVKP